MKFKILVLVIFLAVIAGFVVFKQQTKLVDSETAQISRQKLEQMPNSEVIFWQEKIQQSGGKEAYQEFGDMYGQENIFDQHENAHIFGEALYKAMGVEGVSVCDNSYSYGCYHSFFGFAILDKGIEVLPELDEACIAAYGNKGLGCQHGIGHGVIVELGYENLNEALTECATLKWKGPIGGCSSGVLMEFNHHTMDETGSRQPINNDYHYPCSEIDSRFIEACYFEQPAWWNVLEEGSYTFIGEECEKAQTLLGKEACYRGVGNLAAGVTMYSIPEILKVCQAMPNPEGEILCIEGAAWNVSFQPGFEDTWTELCEPYGGAYYKRCIDSHGFI